MERGSGSFCSVFTTHTHTALALVPSHSSHPRRSSRGSPCLQHLQAGVPAGQVGPPQLAGRVGVGRVVRLLLGWGGGPWGRRRERRRRRQLPAARRGGGAAGPAPRPRVARAGHSDGKPAGACGGTGAGKEWGRGWLRRAAAAAAAAAAPFLLSCHRGRHQRERGGNRDGRRGNLLLWWLRRLLLLNVSDSDGGERSRGVWRAGGGGCTVEAGQRGHEGRRRSRRRRLLAVCSSTGARGGSNGCRTSHHPGRGGRPPALPEHGRGRQVVAGEQGRRRVDEERSGRGRGGRGRRGRGSGRFLDSCWPVLWRGRGDGSGDCRHLRRCRGGRGRVGAGNRRGGRRGGAARGAHAGRLAAAT